MWNMAADSTRQSPLALVVLAFLSERPMHAYRMFQLMQQREKGSIVNLAQRNSLYQAMNRLVKSGLAEVDSTERAENRPERTVYRITDAGKAALHQWTLELLRDETPEFPSMPVAISLMMLLSPVGCPGCPDRSARSAGRFSRCSGRVARDCCGDATPAAVRAG